MCMGSPPVGECPRGAQGGSEDGDAALTQDAGPVPGKLARHREREENRLRGRAVYLYEVQADPAPELRAEGRREHDGVHSLVFDGGAHRLWEDVFLVEGLGGDVYGVQRGAVGGDHRLYPFPRPF